jgi:hypothetical protein
VADAVVDALRADGHIVWVDRSPQGDGWGGRLLDTVWSCDVVVFLVSAAAAASERARREVHVAGAERTPVVPVLLEEVALPPDLAWYVAAAQPVDLRTNVTVGLRSLLLRVGSTPRKRVARPWLLARRLALATLLAALVFALARYLL